MLRQYGKLVRASLMVSLMLVAIIGIVIAGPYEDAESAYARHDYDTAVRILRSLAEQGNATAQHALGNMYSNGDGVSKDAVEAVRWFRRAADQGNPDSQANLGAHYSTGSGVPKDYVLSYMWFSLSASQGNQDAVKVISLLTTTKTIPPAMITEAQKLAREWKPKPETPGGWWQRVVRALFS